MKKKKASKSDFSWRSLLMNKAFDLVIVVVGVTIAFQLGSLKQHNDERKLERFYLESMLNDIDQDVREYNDNLTELKRDHRFAYNCLARMEKKEDVADSLGIVVWNISSIKTFEGHRNSYSTILSGNGLSIIQDTNVRNYILEHYRLYASIERFESNYYDVISRCNDYFSLYIDYNKAGKIADKSVTRSIQTKNLLTLSAVHLQSGIWRYEESLQKARLLQDGINSYLNN